jgi:TolB-like protein/Tfp pilus assembly protein PilF
MSPDEIYEFGEFTLDVIERRLLRGRVIIPLAPKALDVLVELLRHAGHLITKRELLELVWPESFVDEGVLAVHISALRKVFGDNTREPRYIATVPTVGYRFVCDVRIVAQEEEPVITPQVRIGSHALAVLPFATGTGPTEAEYLSEGISESIINLLSQFPDLRVVPRTSAFRYRGFETQLKKVGRDLNVNVVLTGTVAQRGDRLIVQAELIDIGNDAQIWGSQFNRELDDIFEVQEELARRICESLRLRLSSEEDRFLTRRPTENREAYHLYLKAIHFANKWSPAGIQQGIALSRQAIEADPLFARAYAGLAYIYILLGTFGGLPPLQAFPMAKAAAQRALEIDDTMATAHACLAYLLLVYEWDWAGAERESRRAIELAPNIPGGHYVRSHWCLAVGQPDEAILEARRALDLDPLSLPNHQLASVTYFVLGKYDSAIEQCHKALELESSFAPARQFLALCYAFRGSCQKALAEADMAIALSAKNTQAEVHAVGTWGIVHAVAGKETEARTALTKLAQCQPPYDYFSVDYCACIHALLGDKDEAFRWLGIAGPGRGGLYLLNIRPEFKSLYADRRFNDLLRRIGLPANGLSPHVTTNLGAQPFPEQNLR